MKRCGRVRAAPRLPPESERQQQHLHQHDVGGAVRGLLTLKTLHSTEPKNMTDSLISISYANEKYMKQVMRFRRLFLVYVTFKVCCMRSRR